jgi:hypothetical protein
MHHREREMHHREREMHHRDAPQRDAPQRVVMKIIHPEG